MFFGNQKFLVAGMSKSGAASTDFLLRMIRPKITVPMHYHLPGGTLGIAPPDAFLKRMGAENCVRMRKLSLPCPEAEGKTVVLEVKR